MTVREKMAEPDRSQLTIRRMRIACWIIKATDTDLPHLHTHTHTHTHTQYVIFTAFPLPHWLHERAST
jgi:hypothetical protein